MKIFINDSNKSNDVLTVQLPGFRLFFIVVLAVFVVTGTAFAQKTAPDPGIGGTVFGVEIDADFFSGTKPAFWNSSNYTNLNQNGADWSGAGGILNKSGVNSIPGRSADGRTLWQQDGNWGNKSGFAEISTFSGTSNKNGQTINSSTTGGEPYTAQPGGTGPQKNDITDMFLHTREVMVSGNPHTILFFGAATRATSGSSYLDFEYNQAGVTIANGFITGNGTVGGRTPGDFVLVVNYEGGGARPVVGYRVWLVSGVWSEEQMVTGSNGYITTNISTILPVAPNMGVASDGSFANTTGAFQFVEGGVDITALNLDGVDLCNPLATLMAKTRSSTSFTAELKDFSVATFPLIPGSTLADITPLTKCAGESAVLTTTVSGEGALGSNVKWFKVTGTSPEVEVEIMSGITSTATGSTLTINNLTTAQAGLYRARLTGATCGDPAKSASLTVNPTPAGTNTTQALCPMSIGGTTAVFNLTSRNSTVTGGVPTVSVVGWYASYSGGVFSNEITAPAAYTSATGNTVYAKLSGTGGCIGVAENTLTVNATPSGTNTSMESCPTTSGGTTAIFNLNSKNNTVVGSSGASVEGWYETYASGSFSNPIATPASYNSATGKTVYAKLVGSAANGSCMGVAQNVLTVSPSAPGPGLTYNAPACHETTFSVTVNSPVVGATYSIVNSIVLVPGVLNAQNIIAQEGVPVIFTNRMPGTGYSVTATIGECISEATTCQPPANIQQNQATSSLRTTEVQEQLTAYPVPFSDKVTIEFTAEKEGEFVINLYDLKGGLVKQLKAGTAKVGEVTTVDVDGRTMAEGMYLARMVNGRGTKTIKLLKKN